MARLRSHGLVVAVWLAVLSIGGPRVSAASASPHEELAIQAVMVQDLSLAVAAWIPCRQGRAVPLSQATVHAQQARVDALISQTYAAGEPTHAGLGSRLKALIASYGINGTATRAGEALCDVSGGIDHVQVRAYARTGDRARMTLQAHEWNETVGRQHNVPFHNTLQARIQQTDALIMVHGHWRVLQRGPMTFVSGAP